MTKQKAYNKILILFVTAVFTLVNLSVVSSVFCSMEDTASCCCMQKTENKSCCVNKKEIKFTSHCGCEIKEAKNTDPAELTQSYTVSSGSKTSKMFTVVETLFSGNENIKNFSRSAISTFHSPPVTDINTLKCVLRI